MLVNRYRGKGDYLFGSYEARLEDIVLYFMFLSHFPLSSRTTKSSGVFLRDVYLNSTFLVLQLTLFHLPYQHISFSFCSLNIFYFN